MSKFSLRFFRTDFDWWISIGILFTIFDYSTVHLQCSVVSEPWTASVAIHSRQRSSRLFFKAFLSYPVAVPHIYTLYTVSFYEAWFSTSKERLLWMPLSAKNMTLKALRINTLITLHCFFKLHIMYSTPPLPKHTYQVRVLGLKKFLITLTVRDVVFFSCVSHFPTDTKDQL